VPKTTVTAAGFDEILHFTRDCSTRRQRPSGITYYFVGPCACTFSDRITRTTVSVFEFYSRHEFSGVSDLILCDGANKGVLKEGRGIEPPNTFCIYAFVAKNNFSV